MTRAREARILVASVSAAWALVLAVIASAAVRVFQVTSGPRVDPATVDGRAHSGFLWLTWTVLYGAGLFAIAASWLVGAHPAVAARALPPAVAIAGAMILVQSIFFP